MPDRMKGSPPSGRPVTLASWRTAPLSRWGLQHVREIVPSADPSITRFGGFNLFAQQLQSKPLVLGCRQPVARHR